MIIRYTGPKAVKVIEYNHLTYVFSPEAEVSSPLVLKFLLNPDMRGLFVIAAEVSEEDKAIAEKERDDKIKAAAKKKADDKKKAEAAKKKADKEAKDQKDK